MADGGEIAFVFSVLELNFFFRQPIPIDRANQLLIFLQQSLSEFLCLLIVHFSLSSLFLKPSWFRSRNWEYMHRGRPVNLRVFDERTVITTARKAPAPG